MSGIVTGSIIHIHRARTIIVDASGLITASGLGSGLYSSQHYSLFIFLILLFKSHHFVSFEGHCTKYSSFRKSLWFYVYDSNHPKFVYFQVAVKVLEKETILMELAVVPGMEDEGAQDVSMGL